MTAPRTPPVTDTVATTVTTQTHPVVPTPAPPLPPVVPAPAPTAVAQTTPQPAPCDRHGPDERGDKHGGFGRRWK